MVMCISLQSAIFFEQFEGFSEHGIFHGITVWQENNSLKIKDKNSLLIIEMGVNGTHWYCLALAGTTEHHFCYLSVQSAGK